MVRGLLRLGVGLGSEPDEGARTWPLWPCPFAPAPQLVCSLAYSATGSLTQSEDLAQETFVSAWKDLRLLCEPLVLFYREHKSVGRVTADLELSEDAVEQCLLRGRKLLQEQVLAFVEGALDRPEHGVYIRYGGCAAGPGAPGQR
jgi:hypothetical protein